MKTATAAQSSGRRTHALADSTAGRAPRQAGGKSEVRRQSVNCKALTPSTPSTSIEEGLTVRVKWVLLFGGVNQLRFDYS